MSHIQFIDELIREYLLYRGFSNSLKMFDAELKADKEKGFRVDKIVDQLMQYIYAYDLIGLRELWGHLDQKMFSKLQSEFTSAVRKLESSILKYYLVNAVSNNKPDKLVEFFTKLTPELHGHPDWKDWFALPYVKNPEDNPTFSVCFTRVWQDTLMVSLHNFLAIVYQSVPLPALAQYEEECARIRRLTEENESLRSRLAAARPTPLPLEPLPHPPADLMDDFYIIAQEVPAAVEVQGKSLKSLIRTIGGGLPLPTSPVLGRKPNDASHKRAGSKQKMAASPSSALSKTPTESTGITKRSVSLETRSRTKNSAREASLDRTNRSARHEFLLLSQEEVGEHRAPIAQCRFNTAGSLVASCDAEGVLNVWSHTPHPRLVCSQRVVGAGGGVGAHCLDWVSRNERYLVCGTGAGTAVVCDTQAPANDSRPVAEIAVDEPAARVASVTCSPSESVFVSCTVSGKNRGKLQLHDIKTKKLERCLSLGAGAGGSYATCCSFNHNGSLVVVGCSDGRVRTLDPRTRDADVVDSWAAHASPVLALRLSADLNHCYSLGSDRLYRHSVGQTRQPAWEAVLPTAPAPATTCFALDQSGQHALLAGPQSPPTIHQMEPGGGVSRALLRVGGGASGATTCDWTSANQCGTSATGGADHRLRLSTFLTPTPTP